MIFFRSDASSIIGTGHVMRCLTLAKALRKHGTKCKFICRNHKGNLIKIIKKEGFEVKSISNLKRSKINRKFNKSGLTHARWLGASWQEDANDTIKAIGKEKIDWLIVDHYAIDKKWEEKLRPYTKKIMVIDDLADRNHDCDLLLDQNLVVNFNTRYDNLLSKKCNFLLGPRYALLQSEYAKLRELAKPKIRKVQRILVFFGGSDRYNLTRLTLSTFLKLNRTDIVLDVVLDLQSKYSKKILSLAKYNSNITLHKTLPSLAPLMLKADLSIGAGGSTTWERCCLGLPSIIIVSGMNQEKIAEAMKSAEAAFVFKPNVKLQNNIRQALLFLLKESDVYLKMSKKAFSICDGKGINRVIKKLI